MIEPKETIKNIWRPAPETESRTDIFRFDRNERTTLFTNEEFQSMLFRLTPYDFVAYGELEPFYQKTKDWLNVDRTNILFTSGSDTGIRAVYETFVEKGDEVAILVPTYAMFSAYTNMFGAREIQWKYNSDLTLDIQALISSINSKMKLITIANPNHTGTVIEEADLIKIIETAKKFNCLVLLDEAYHHFYPKTMLKHINHFENLIIVRTFSKAFGIASLRIGLLVANKKMIDELYKVKLVHEINGVAAKIGCYLLDHIEIMQNYVEAVNKGKDVLYTRLSKLGWEVLKSEANFIFFKTSINVDPNLLISKLAERKLYIKGPFEKHPFSGHLRVTTGDEEQMNLLCDEIERLINE